MRKYGKQLQNKNAFGRGTTARFVTESKTFTI